MKIPTKYIGTSLEPAYYAGVARIVFQSIQDKCEIALKAGDHDLAKAHLLCIIDICKSTQTIEPVDE